MALHSLLVNLFNILAVLLRNLCSYLGLEFLNLLEERLTYFVVRAIRHQDGTLGGDLVIHNSFLVKWYPLVEW